MPNLYTSGQSLNAPLIKGTGDSSQPGFASPTGDAGVVRPVGPSGSQQPWSTPNFDPSYLQNLATSTGGMFMRPQGGVLNFNPLGDLSDVPNTPKQGGGNAPLFGLPQTLLGYAQSIAPPPASPTTPGTTAPATTGTGVGSTNYLGQNPFQPGDPRYQSWLNWASTQIALNGVGSLAGPTIGTLTGQLG